MWEHCNKKNKANKILRGQQQAAPRPLHYWPRTHTRLDSCPKQKSPRGHTNPALFRSTVAAPLSSCSDYLHPSNNTAAREDPRVGRRCLSIQRPLLLERGRGGMVIQDSDQDCSEVVVPGRERGLKLLLPTGNEYLNNSVITSDMCYITLCRTDHKRSKGRPLWLKYLLKCG